MKLLVCSQFWGGSSSSFSGSSGGKVWSISWNFLAPSLCPTPQVILGFVQYKMKRKLCSLLLGVIAASLGFLSSSCVPFMSPAWVQTLATVPVSVVGMRMWNYFQGL